MEDTESVLDKILKNAQISRKFIREIKVLIFNIKKIIDEGTNTKNKKVKQFMELHKIHTKIKVDNYAKYIIPLYEEHRVRLLEQPYSREWPITDSCIIRIGEKNALEIDFTLVDDVEAPKNKSEDLKKIIHKSLLSLFLIIAEIDDDDEGKMHIVNNIRSINEELGLLPKETNNDGLMSQLMSMFDSDQVKSMLDSVGGKEGLQELMKDPKQLFEKLSKDEKLKKMMDENLPAEMKEKMKEYLPEDMQEKLNEFINK